MVKDLMADEPLILAVSFEMTLPIILRHWMAAHIVAASIGISFQEIQ